MARDRSKALQLLLPEYIAAPRGNLRHLLRKEATQAAPKDSLRDLLLQLDRHSPNPFL